MNQLEYENQEDPQRQPSGSVEVQRYSSDYIDEKGIMLWHVETQGRTFTYGSVALYETLYCLTKDGKIDYARPSVFRTPLDYKPPIR